jgi:ribosomal-protein-alanine acetyltransferase/tRNA threonylcarbamoyl adenosine modification protein YeaZ
MLLLAVDSSSDRLKIGVADEQHALAGYDSGANRTHSEKMISAVESVLKEAGIAPSQLDYLAVAGGPGSFTGLRVGIATVLGLAQAWQKQIMTGANPMLERMFFIEQGQKPVSVIHCRADQFYVSENGRDIVIRYIQELVAGYADSLFAGPGVERLSKAAAGIGKELAVAFPSSYNGGELAHIFARHFQLWNRLDPANLDVNYLLKSQPEQRRDAATADGQIVEMTYSDIDDVLTIEREAFTDAWDRDSFRSDIDSPHVMALAIHKLGRCTGYLCCIALDDYGYIANIAVDQQYRSQGLGRLLLNDLRRRLLANGIDQMVLDVRTTNKKAIRFYEKYGFEVITRRKGFYVNPPDDSFTMQMTIGE